MKFSTHLVFRIFQNHVELSFSNNVRRLKKLVELINPDPVTGLDMAVYGPRLFRTIGSSKPGEERPPVFHESSEFPDGVVEVKQKWINSFIQSLPPDTLVDLPLLTYRRAVSHSRC